MSFRRPVAVAGSLAAAALTALAASLVASPAHALEIRPALQSFISGTLGGDPSFKGTVGYRFTASTALTVSALGFFDDQEDGLLSSHEVGIFAATSQQLLGSATIAAGSSAYLQGGFRWVSISPFTLTPGDYVIAATLPGDPTSFDPVNYAATDPVTIEGLILSSQSLTEVVDPVSLVMPTVDEGVGYGFFGAGFATPVPTPGPLPLFGAAAAFGWSRRLRRRTGGARLRG
jgi:hypothetical protein